VAGRITVVLGVPLGLTAGLGWIAVLVGSSRHDAGQGLAPVALATLGALATLHLDLHANPTHPGALRDSVIVVALGAAVLTMPRPVQRTVATAIGAMAFVGGLLRGATDAPPPRGPAPDAPDLILVVVDAWRADHLGRQAPHPTGLTPVTPGLDTLLPAGRRWSSAVTPAPWTLPAFASLLTGERPAEHRAGLPGFEGRPRPLGTAGAAIAQRLHAAGYHTAGIVSNPWLFPAWGVSRGFAHWDARLGWPRRPALLHPLDVAGYDLFVDRYARPASAMVEAAEHWWDDHIDRPRFLLLHLMDPHGPWPPVHGPDPETADRRAYAAEVRRMDRALAPRLAQWIAEGATVILTSDHGERLARRPDGGIPTHRHGAALRPAVVQVPLVVWSPDVVPGVDDTPVSTREVADTLLRAAGQPTASTGRDLRGPVPDDRAVVTEAPRVGPWRQRLQSGDAVWIVGPGVDRVTRGGRPVSGPAADAVRAALGGLRHDPTTAAAPSGPVIARQALEALGYVDGDTGR